MKIKTASTLQMNVLLLSIPRVAWKIQNLASVGQFLAHARVVLMRSNSVAYHELPRKAGKYSVLWESFKREKLLVFL